MDQLLSSTHRAKLDACLAQAVTPPWRLVSTQPFAKHLSVTIEARSDELELPHRPIQMRQQQYVEIVIGRANVYSVPSAKEVQSLVSLGIFKPLGEVGGIAAAAFAPFAPYENGDWTVFLNISGRERCRYRALATERPNPFVDCTARLGEYTAGITFPHDAIAHLPRLFADARPLMSRVTSCFDLTEEP